MLAEEHQVRRVPLTWVGTEDVPIFYVNEALGQVGSYGEILLTLGQSTPPAFLAENEEDRRRMFEEVTAVPVKPVARVALTRTTLTRLLTALQTTLKTYDELQQDELQAPPTTEEGQNGGT